MQKLRNLLMNNSYNFQTIEKEEYNIYNKYTEFKT